MKTKGREIAPAKPPAPAPPKAKKAPVVAVAPTAPAPGRNARTPAKLAKALAEAQPAAPKRAATSGRAKPQPEPESPKTAVRGGHAKAAKAAPASAAAAAPAKRERAKLETAPAPKQAKAKAKPVEPKPEAKPKKTPKRATSSGAKLTDPLGIETIQVVTVRPAKRATRRAVPAVAPKRPKQAEAKPLETKKKPVAKRKQPPAPEPAPILAAAPKRPRLTVAERKAATATLYVARGGAPRGLADYEVPFESRPQALAFLVNQHGLTFEEQKKLAKTSSLRLNRRWHGSDGCAIREVRLTPEEAQRVLRGESAPAS